MPPAAAQGSSAESAHDEAHEEAEFEEKEHQLFGEHGFEQVVEQVADLEEALGIHDLESFTPA